MTMNRSPEVCFDGLLSSDTNERLCTRLAEALDNRHTGMVFARCPETSSALALHLFEGVVGAWQAAGPMDADAARQWAQRIRDNAQIVNSNAADPNAVH